MADGINEENKRVVLQREIGLVSAVNFMLGCVIGTGLFITPGSILAVSGSIGMSLLVWVLCGFISLLTCLPFGELSTVVPKSGCMYIYVLTAFKDMHTFFGGLPAFTFFIIVYFIIAPSQTALAAIMFVDYLFVIVNQFFEHDQRVDDTFYKLLTGTAVLVIVGVINCYSVRFFIKSQDILCYIKMAAIAFFIGCGFYLFATGKAIKFNPGFEGTDYSVSALTQVIFFGLFSYDGGVFITNITEELKTPEKNILRSILIGLLITTVASVLLNVAFFTALTPKEISAGTTIITQFATKLFGASGGSISALIICLVLLTNIMAVIFYITRLGFVAGREGHMIEFLSCIHKTHQTPSPSVVLQVALSLLFYIFGGGNADLFINMYAFFMWLCYGVTMVALFILRRKLPGANRPFRVPTIIPVFVGLFSLYLSLASLISGQLRDVLIFFAICIALSTFIYYIFIYKKPKFKEFGKFQKKLQRSLGLVLPPQELVL